MYVTENEKNFEMKKYLHRKEEDFHCKKQKLIYQIQHITATCSILSSSLVYVEQWLSVTWGNY